MADAVGIAGLAVAIFDQLLKLGERTVETVQDVRGFDEDLRSVLEIFKKQQWRTKALKHLLFEKSPVYNAKTLFDQYDDEAQENIRAEVQELLDTLRNAYAVLGRHLGSERALSAGHVYSLQARSPSPSYSNSANSGSGDWIRTPVGPASLATKLRWSWYDKKRVKELLQRYHSLNDSLHQTVELISLASNIGVGLQHLENMQNSATAKELGYDETATLRLAAIGAVQGMKENLELGDDWHSSFQDKKLVDERFSTCSLDGKAILCEKCEYKVAGGQEIDHQTRSRLNSLTTLLRQPKEQMFRIPRCVGWKFLPFTNNITFVFESPGDHGTCPRSLFWLLKSGGVKPHLEDKFMLAHSLANSVSQLQMVQWVHESFRSENILFFLPPDPLSGQQPEVNHHLRVPFDQPWIFGFDFSRPESFFSHGFTDLCLDRDVYRHPDRQGMHNTVFSKWHDIYALGVVLLEIGLWETAIEQEHPRKPFRNMHDPGEIRDRLVKVAEARLRRRMGLRYTNIVVACLKGEFGVTDNTKDDIRLQQAFRAQVVDVLARSLENI